MTSASTYSKAEETAAEQSEAPNTAAANSHIEALRSLPTAKPPDLAEDCLFHGLDWEADNVEVILSQVAVRHIAAHSYSNLDYELGGALLGRAFQANGQVFVLIKAAIPASTADHGPVHFTFTADAWSQLHRDRAESYPDLDIVGWFHTHPDLGVFYSSDDVVVHSAAFTQPWHVGMVIDPVRKETSFFGWVKGKLEAKKGFFELTELQPYSLVEWKAVQTSVWDYPYEAYAPEETSSSLVYLHPSKRPMLPAITSYIGFIVGALGLLLSVFLLVAWVWPLTREVDRLQNMVIVLADSAMADSNAATCPDPRLRILTPIGGQSINASAEVEITGTAMVEGANRYQVHVRPETDDNWLLVGSSRRGTKLGELANWDTSTIPAGNYEVRLTAVDNNNIRLAGSPPCSVSVQLIP